MHSKPVQTCVIGVAVVIGDFEFHVRKRQLIRILIMNNTHTHTHIRAHTHKSHKRHRTNDMRYAPLNTLAQTHVRQVQRFVQGRRLCYRRAPLALLALLG